MVHIEGSVTNRHHELARSAGALKGGIYKINFLNQQRVLGGVSGIAGILMYHNFPYFAAMLSSPIATVAVFGFTFNFFSAFRRENYMVSSSFDAEGMLNIAYKKTAF
jgi:hypothetical protein